MKTTLVILTATTALAAFLALPAIGAVYSNTTGDSDQLMTMNGGSSHDNNTLLASNDDDDDHKYKSKRYSDDEDDEDYGRRSNANPAPADSISPPANGLFETGPASQVQIN